jgi:hypothetical protein
MGALRAINLLQGVEGQTTLGAALETILAGSEAKKAEFGAMLSTRHMARRMAGNPVTMTAINASEKAIEIVFENTTELNAEPIKEIAKNATAMGNTSQVLTSLHKVIDNDVAFGHYSASAFYEANIINTLTTIIGRDPANYVNISALILDSAAMGEIATNTRAMKAVVKSSPAMAVVTANSLPMIDLASNNDAMSIVANSDLSMRLIAQSQTALDEVTNGARAIVVGVPSAVLILGSYDDAWDYIMHTSNTLAANIYGLLIIFTEVDPTAHTSVTQIFNSSVASLKIANSRPAMVAVMHESTTLAIMIVSPNLETIFSSSVAVSEIADHPDGITAVAANTDAWNLYLAAPLFALNLKNIVANLAGLTVSDYVNVDALIASSAALTAIAANAAASQALSTSSDAIATLASSANLSIILGSATAMTYFGTEAILQAFLAVPSAVSVVFGSSVAKGVIVASDVLMDLVAATPAITSYLAGIAVTAIPSNLNSVGANNVFGGFPAKFITLSIRANNIGAIAMTFTLAGTPLAGTAYGNVVSASGTVTATAVLGLSNPATWKASGIAATAAASPEVTYVDMT